MGPDTRRATAQELAINGGSPVRQTFLPFGAPALGDQEIDAVVQTLRSGWIGTGPKTELFEQEFATYVGSKHAVAVSSCTAALHLSLIASGVGAGDEVITTPLTFAATANSILHCGAIPVFVDIDPDTLNIDIKGIEAAITPKTKAIIPVHFGGLPCDMDAVLALAGRHNLVVIEDAAHAVGAKYKGRMIGSVGALTCFSFYPNKNLTTIEGGMVTTERDDWAESLRVYRLHGLSRDAWRRYRTRRLSPSDALVPGFKYNMTDVQAVVGSCQLARLEAFTNIRQAYARRYDEAFAGLEGVRMQPRSTADGNRHALHLYVLIIDPSRFRCGRDDLINALLEENIGAALHYRALHVHPLYANRFGYRPNDFPHANRIGERILSLPLSPAMSETDADDVIEAVHKVFSAYHR